MAMRDAQGRERRQLGLLIVELLVPLLLIGSAEAGVRWYVNRAAPSMLPRLFPFPITTGKYLAYRALGERPGRLDVLLMGMSPMLRVNARSLADAISARQGRAATVFNFAAPLQTVAFNDRLLNEVLLPIKPPRLVVYGVMPVNLLHDERPPETEKFIRASPVFKLHDGSLSARLQAVLIDHVALVRYREVLRDELRFTAAAEPADFVQMAQTTDANGDIPFVAPVEPVRVLTPWEHDYARQLRAFDRIMRTTLLFDHLAALAQHCRARGIRFALMNNAVHPIFLSLLPHGRADYDRFVERLRDVAATAGVPFFNPAPDGVGDPELFQDTHHHNVRGSQWLTEQIADSLARERLL